MELKNIRLFDINKIKNINKIYAHKKEVNVDKNIIIRRETLSKHMTLSYKYFLKLVDDIKLKSTISTVESTFFEKNEIQAIELWREMLCNTIYMHDIGKATHDFQYKVMGNNEFTQTANPNTKHSLLSALVYMDIYYQKAMILYDQNKIKEETMDIVELYILANAYIISKHHTRFDNINEFINDLRQNIKANNNFNKENYNDTIGEVNFINVNEILIYGSEYLNTISKDNRGITLYIYSKLLYSLLTSADFYATYEFMNESEIKDLGRLHNIEEYTNIYKNMDIYKSIQLYKKYQNGQANNPYKKGDINELRSAMFLESEKQLLNNIDKSIFYLEAPTGAGKTNMSINLALNIINDKNQLFDKIFYIFPYNNLIEQTKDTLYKTFNNEEIKQNIAVINSITSIQLNKKDEEEISYDKALLDWQFLHYPIVLTSHVNFFNILFGTHKKNNLPLCHLANSVIIIDEIQSYKNKIWKEIIIFLKTYANILNIKIIIMSATLPKLSQLLDGINDSVDLIINKEKYFQNPLFKNRVEINFELLDIELDNKDDIESLLLEKIKLENKKKNKNILIEFIKKSTALYFYKLLKNDETIDKKVLLLTGDDNKLERKKIINTIKKEKNIILVATQVIEAGVDIDMDIGFKDISILDAEEQFLGRINRSCKKNDAIVYFFDWDETTMYQKDYRNNEILSLKNKETRNYLKNKTFDKFYNEVFNRIEDNGNSGNDNYNIESFFKEEVSGLIYKKIKERMELITKEIEDTIFINTTIEYENKKIKGEDIWQQYKDLLMDNTMGYAQKRVELSKISEYMDCFTYNVKYFKDSYDEIVGGIIYISDGEERYFENGKFDRSKLKNNFEII